MAISESRMTGIDIRITSQPRIRFGAIAPYAALLIIALVSAGQAADQRRAYALLLEWFAYAALALIVFLLPARISRGAAFLLLGSAAIFAVLQFVGMLGATGQVIRPYFFVFNTNCLGAAMIPALALAVRWRQWVWGGLFALVLVMSGSRSALIGAGAGALVYLFMNWRAFRLSRGRVAIIGIGMALLAPLVISQALGHATHGFPSQRLDLWRVAFMAWQDSPLVGVGPAHFIYAFQDYAQVDHARVEFHAHSIYLQILSELGLVGWLALVWMFSSFLRSALEKHNSIAAAMIVGIAAAGATDYVYWGILNVITVIVVSRALATDHQSKF